MGLLIEIPAEVTELVRRLEASDAVLAKDQAVKDFLPGFNRDLVETSQQNTGGGNFARGWLATSKGQGGGFHVANIFGKAAYVEYPTRPHEIVPVRAKMLAWIPGRGAFSAFKVNKSTKAGAGFVYAKKVQHPGWHGAFIFDHVMLLDVPFLFQRIVTECKSYLAGE